jgi:DNA-binding NarL/FixJ family response regulator
VIRIVLVDDEQLIRSGLRHLLELGPDMQLVGEAADGEQALEVIPSAAPDVVLMDVRMPGMSGLDVIARLRARLASPPASLVLTTFDEPDLLLSAVRQGARGFLSKDVSLEELLGAIRALAGGGTWFQPSVTAALRRGLRRLPSRLDRDDSAERLTDREVEVLRLIAGGLTNREVGEALNTAEGTVKNQVASILSKLAVRDRTLAVLKAIEAGIL